MQHDRQAVNHDIEKTADEKPENKGQNNGWHVHILLRFCKGWFQDKFRMNVDFSIHAKTQAACTLRMRLPFNMYDYDTTLPMLNSGKYIATKIVPMITPSTTIMIGSIKEDKVATAASTSSS